MQDLPLHGCAAAQSDFQPCASAHCDAAAILPAMSVLLDQHHMGGCVRSPGLALIDPQEDPL